MKNRVSIIIPTFNRAESLVGALKSAQRQTYSNLEIVVSDNASSDNTEHIIQPYLSDERLKYFRNNRNMGMVANWRECLYRRATGDWFLILSDDDLLINDRYIEKAMNELNRSENVGIIYSSSEIFYDELNRLELLRFEKYGVLKGMDVFMSRGTVLPQDFVLCSVIFDRKLSMQYNAFMNDADVACDSELFLKICVDKDVLRLDEMASRYTIHKNNLINGFRREFDLLSQGLNAYASSLSYAIQRGKVQQEDIKKWEEQVINPVMVFLFYCCFRYHIWDVMKLRRIMESSLPYPVGRAKSMALLARGFHHFVKYRRELPEVVGDGP